VSLTGLRSDEEEKSHLASDEDIAALGPRVLRVMHSHSGAHSPSTSTLRVIAMRDKQASARPRESSQKEIDDCDRSQVLRRGCRQGGHHLTRERPANSREGCEGPTG
jgi:hypothetical protein